jgi:hypothetical protein
MMYENAIRAMLLLNNACQSNNAIDAHAKRDQYTEQFMNARKNAFAKNSCMAK